MYFFELFLEHDIMERHNDILERQKDYQESLESLIC